jgi:hypothetical protein
MEKDLKDILSKTTTDDNSDKSEKSEKSEKDAKKLKKIPKLVMPVTENSKIFEETKKPEKCIYDKEWSKLEKGFKLNRMNKYIMKLKNEHGLNDTDLSKLKILLHRAVNENMLKKSDINYENSEIVKINTLEYIDGNFSIKVNKSKNRTNTKSKSKSNLDRIMKK